MTYAAVALMGMTMGQPAGQPATPALGTDYYPMNSRTIKLPIEYKKDKRTIRHVQLFVARNGENTWYQEGLVTPDKDSFVYIAKDDGIYWFKMVIVDLQGNKDVPNITQDAPENTLKMVIDTTPPQVRVADARRNGEEIVIKWAIEDKFPNDAQTKVHFRPTANPQAYWTEVERHPTSPTGVGFKCGTTDGITVKITAVDIAGNRTEITKDYPAVGANQSTSLSPPNITVPPPVNVTPPAKPDNGTGTGAGAIVPPPSFDPVLPGGPGPIAPSGGPITPPAPPAPPVSTPPAPVIPITPPTYQTQPQPQPQPPAGNQNPGGDLKPLATVDPKAPPAPVLPTQGSAPAGGWPGPAPTVEVSRAQVINYARFDLGFDLEQHGPSGIKRVDLWVTRDEGKSWQKWSQHDGKGGAVRVALDVPGNAQLEGNYGFRLVPTSGAGLSEAKPEAGDAPDMRVVLDVTPPEILLFPPAHDRTAPDTLILQWKATDRNFGEDPITLEWSENAAGPWHPVVPANDPIVRTAAVAAPVAKRIANTGQYGWRVPAGTPAYVYMKVTARDAAGNVKEVVTRDPMPVDLTTPRAKINGIVPPVTPRP
jgi:hypothetical protein